MTDSTSFTGLKGGTELVALHRNRTDPHHRPLPQAALVNGGGDWLVTGRGVARALVADRSLTSDLTRRSEKSKLPGNMTRNTVHA